MPETQAKPTPTGSSGSPAPSPRVSRTTPAPASSTHATSRAWREPASATPSGPRNSIVTATPSGIRAIASKNASVNRPEQAPSATAARRSARGRPRSVGRANGHRISAASVSRSATVPAGPTRSNIGSESAAPSCSVVIDATASAMPGARPAAGSGTVGALSTRQG